MKMIKNIIEYLFAIAVIPAIVLTVISVTELKDVKTVQYELLSEEDGIFNVTPGTYDRLVENKKIKNYELESNYPLITKEEMDRATWKVGDLENEIYIDNNGQKRIRLNVGQITFDGSDDEIWHAATVASHSGYFAMFTEIQNAVVTGRMNSYNAPNYNYEQFKEATEIAVHYTNTGFYVKVPATNATEFKEYLSQNPLTITYELIVKNPNSMIIKREDIFTTSDYVRLTKPNDFSNNPNGLYINIYEIARFEVTENWIYVYPSGITVVEGLASRLVGNTLYYELPSPSS